LPDKDIFRKESDTEKPVEAEHQARAAEALYPALTRNPADQQ